MMACVTTCPYTSRSKETSGLKTLRKARWASVVDSYASKNCICLPGYNCRRSIHDDRRHQASYKNLHALSCSPTNLIAKITSELRTKELSQLFRFTSPSLRSLCSWCFCKSAKHLSCGPCTTNCALKSRMNSTVGPKALHPLLRCTGVGVRPGNAPLCRTTPCLSADRSKTTAEEIAAAAPSLVRQASYSIRT